MSAPIRVQLSRRKGWRMPENTVSVARPGKFGNPFTVAGAWYSGMHGTGDDLAAFVVGAFGDWLNGSTRMWMGEESDKRRASIRANLEQLRGKNLACWCKPGAPCHADVLISLANSPTGEPIS